MQGHEGEEKFLPFCLSNTHLQTIYTYLFDFRRIVWCSFFMSIFNFRAKRAPSRRIAALVCLLALRVSAADTTPPDGPVARLGSHRFEHSGRLTGLAFTPDGTELFATGMDEACFWEVATGEKQRVLAKTSLMCGALAQDGQTAALAHNSSLIEVFDTVTGERRGQLTGARDRSFALTLSPDGRRAASGDGRDVILWDVQAGKELRRWQPSGEWVDALKFSPDGRRLAMATAGTNGQVRIENLDSDGAPMELAGGIGFEPWLVFSPDGKNVAGSCDVPFHGGHRSYLRIWDAATGQMTHDVPGSFNAGVFSADGKWLVAAGLGEVAVYDPATGQVLHQLPANQQHIWAVALTADGKTLATAQDQRIRLWNTGTWQEINAGSGHDEPVLALAVAPDGRTIATGGLDGRLILWDWPEARERKRIEGIGGGYGVQQLAFSPDSGTVGAAAWINFGDTFFLFDAATGAPVSRFGKEHQGHALAFMAGGKEVVTGQMDGALGVWEAASGKWLRSVGHHKGSIDSVTPAPDGKTAWWAGEYQGLGLRDLVTGEDLRVLSGGSHHSEACLKVSPDGDWLEVGGRVWDVKTGDVIAQGRDSLAATAISPDGRLLATAAGGGVEFLEMLTRQKIHRLNTGEVKAMAFSPDGTVLVTAAYTEALAWDLTGRLHDGRLPATGLSRTEMESCWQTLAGNDAWAAHQAAWSLAAGGAAAVAFLGEHLHPAADPEPAQVAKLRGEFTDPDYDVRKHAACELLDLGLEVSPGEREALRRPGRNYTSAPLPPDQAGGMPVPLGPIPELLPLPDRVRASRAVMALEHSLAPSAETLLATLADGVADAPMTREARSALARVRQRH
jgi:WD40 repeat protein